MRTLDYALDSMLGITTIFDQLLVLDNYTHGREFIFVLDKNKEPNIKEHFSGIFEFALFVSSVHKRFVIVKSFELYYLLFFTEITLDQIKEELSSPSFEESSDFDAADSEEPNEPWQ